MDGETDSEVDCVADREKEGLGESDSDREIVPDGDKLIESDNEKLKVLDFESEVEKDRLCVSEKLSVTVGRPVPEIEKLSVAPEAV